MSTGGNTGEEAIDVRMQTAEDRLNSMSTSIDDLNDDINEMKGTLEQIRQALNIAPPRSPPLNQQGLSSQVIPVVTARVDARSADSAGGTQSGNMSSKLAHRIYVSTMENTKLSKVPDFRFTTAKIAWERLSRTIPLAEEDNKALMSLAFQGTALKLYEQTVQENPLASTSELWKLLEEKLCNKSHIISLRSKYLNMRWNDKKETLTDYAERLRNTASSLPDNLTDDMMVDTFMKGLPMYLKVRALAVQGSFDEIVSRVSLISNEMKVQRSESFKAIEEGSRDDAVRSDNSGPRQYYRRNKANMTCFRCNKRGHLSYECEEDYESIKKKDGTQGKGQAGTAKGKAVEGTRDQK